MIIPGIVLLEIFLREYKNTSGSNYMQSTLANRISVFPHDFDKLPNMAWQVSRPIIFEQLSLSKAYVRLDSL